MDDAELGVVRLTAEYCRQHEVDLMVMIRPRGGNFTYNDKEMRMMRHDIEVIKQFPISSFVFGAVMNELLEVAGGSGITFRMAFDAITPEHQQQAIVWLVDRGVQRILTHGGSKDQPIEAHFPTLKDHIHYANQRIIMLVGGGVTHQNAQAIADELGINEVHGTKIVNLQK